MSFSKRLFESENWNAESEPNEHARAAPQLRLTAVAMIALGVELCALALPPAPGRAGPVIAIIVAALAVQFWVGWKLWTLQDELERAISLESSSLSIGLVLGLLSLWVPLAVHGLVPFDPVLVIVLVTLAVIVPTIWLTVKRGLTD